MFRHLRLAALLAASIPLAGHAADGKALFASQCAGCHQPDGSGVSGMYPPVAGRLNPWIAAPAGQEYLGQVVLNGLYAPLKIKGQGYAGFMPGFGHLPDADIAAVLNYVATELNPPALDAPPFSADKLASWRAAPKRDAALKTLRDSLPGAEK